MILALAGGVGGAKLAKGLSEVLAPEELLIAVNTGDDFEHLGLHISPDLDTMMYTLAGINDPVQGWGIAGETWSFMQALETLGGETWFRLGDRDLAMHIERTARLRAGHSLSAVTQYLCEQLKIAHRIAPMSDDSLRTIVHTSSARLTFQDYFVRWRAEPAVGRIEFDGAGQARMSAALHAALGSAMLAAVIICPSNPYLSIAPILTVPGVRDALAQRRVPVIAVSPIVAGRALKGPAAKIMRELGAEPSSLAVAEFYRGLIDALVIDEADANLSAAIGALGMQAIVTRTVMHDLQSRIALARTVVDSAQSLFGLAKRRSAR
jgi:LPPG:FO 2-phospho-L-lactate transferase